MDRQDETGIERDMDSTTGDGETHATTGGAAAAGAVTGGVIGMAGGPLGAAIGAVGGAIVGAASERVMHSDDDRERERTGLPNDHDRNPLIEDRAKEESTGAIAPTGTTGTTGTTDRMQLREEELTPRTTQVQTGQVSVSKNVVSEQRTMDVPVTREEAFVQRTPVERRLADGPIAATSERTIDMPVHEERVTLDKQPVVYEEVGVGKHNVTDTTQVSGTVRREEARIEHEGDVSTPRTPLP